MNIVLVLLLLVVTDITVVFGTKNKSCRYHELTKLAEGDPSRISPILENYNTAILMVLGFGGFSVLLAFIHNAIRRHVYHDENSLDTVFDAGGKVSLSLTAVTVTSQLLWPADFLQISTNMTKQGVGGSMYYVIAVVLDILLFPMLSVELKTKAPGAKTYLQIIYARFGKPAHIVFCCIALFSNLVTTTAILLAGKSAISVLTKNTSDEFIAMAMAVLFGSYCFVGGLGTTFYISYFNTALTFVSLSVFVVKFAYLDTSQSNYTSLDNMYEAMSCIQGPDGNVENSLMTFKSRSAIISGLSLFLMTSSVAFCDQANWQSRIAAKPIQGVCGFIIAAFIYFCLPATIAFPVTLTYMSMAYDNGTHLLTDAEINNGYVTPFIMETIMGSQGAYLLITMVTMALMSTGSGEVMAVSSIIVYDIYRVYINPYRKLMTPTSCVLCGNEKISGGATTCRCTSAANCKQCDVDLRQMTRKKFAVQYRCTDHGAYRHYEDLLIHYKSWCIVWVSLLVVPYALIIYASDINLTWTIYYLEALVSPFVIPLLLAITWSGCSASGVITGGVGGLLAAVVGNLIVTAVVYKDDGGIQNFFDNSIQDFSLLAICLCGFLFGSIGTIVTSLKTSKVKSQSEAVKEWEKTIAIDNPLNPWRHLYQNELSDLPLTTRLTSTHMVNLYRSARVVAYAGGLLCFLLFLVVMPFIMTSFDVLDYDQFSSFLKFRYIICIAGAVFVVVVPPAEKVYQIVKAYKKGKKKNVNDKELKSLTQS